MKRVFLLTLSLFFSLFIFSFSKTADEWVSEGDAYLEAHDTVNAYRCYLNAYNLDPNNSGANFGLAILTLPHYLIDGGDNEVSNFLLTNGISLIGNIYDLTINESDVEEHSTIPEIQNFIENHILPYINQTITYLEKVKTNPNFIKTITGPMYKGDSNKEFDYGDLLAGEGVLYLIKGLFNVACAYNLDVDIDFFKGHNIKEILDNYPSFLTLNSDGQSKMNEALSSFQKFLDCLIESYDTIKNETDPQEDDILVFPDNREFNYFKDDIRNLLSDIRNALNPGGTNLDLTDFWLKATYYSQSPPVKMPQTIDLSKFFTNPITRKNLEPLQFDEDGKIIISSLWDFDQTFNGAFPDMTKEEFVGFFRLNDLEDYSVMITGKNKNTIKLFFNDISDISYVKIFRDTTPFVNTNSTLIAQFQPDYFNQINDNFAVSDTYYYKIYCYYSDGSYYSSPAIRAAKKLYVNINSVGIEKGTSNEPYRYIGRGIEYGNIGSEIYVAEGTYILEEGPKNKNLEPKSGMKMIGSCNPSTWESDLDRYPTIIDANGRWCAFDIYGVGDVSIEGFIIKNAYWNGIEIGWSSNINIKNCVIYNNWGGIDFWGTSDLNIINCTIANNWGYWGGGICGAGNNITIKNCIIANNSEGVNLWNVSGLTFSYNDVWGNDTNYSGISDKTGINGNISANPLFVNPYNGNYRLSEGSPCIGAGENGVDMGAYKYVEIKKGDINRDGQVDISDVILCLRMVILLDTPDPSVADMNNDGEVDITDVILILRKAVGLD